MIVHLRCLIFDEIFLQIYTIIQNLTLYNTIPILTPMERKAFENILEKGENAGNQHFLLFPQCFLFFQTRISILSQDYFVVCKYFEFGLV